MTHPAPVLLVLFLLSLVAPVHAADRDSAASRYYENALERYERRDVQGAIIQLKNALQQDTGMLAAHLLIGKAYLKAGQPDAAERALMDAERLGADRSETALLVAQALFEQGKFEGLLDRGVNAGLSPSGRSNLLTLRGLALMELGEFDASGKALEAAEQLEPGAVSVIVARARLALNRGQPDAARALAERAVAAGPADAGAWNILASVRHVLGEAAPANDAYTRALKINPALLDARIGRISLNLDGGDAKAAGADLVYIQKAEVADPRASYLLAMWFARHGNPKAARDYLFATQRQVEMVPAALRKRRGQLLMLGALANHGLGQPEKARTYLHEYIQLHPRQLGARKLLASIHQAAREPARVVEILLPVREHLASDSAALAMLANAYMALNRHATAAALLDDALRDGGTKPLVESTLGFSLLATGQEDAGFERLQKSFAQDPGQASVGMTLVALHLRRGEHARARDVAERLVAQQPDNLTFLNLAGVARGLAGDLKGARRAYEQALARDARFHTARLNLGRLERVEGRLAAARGQFQQVLKADARNVHAMIELGSLEGAAGNVAAGVRWLEKARALQPDSRGAGLQLIALHLQHNTPDQALAVARDLRATAPDDFDVQAALGQTQLAAGQVEAARKTFHAMVRRAGFDVAVLHRVARLQLAAGDRAGAEYSLQKALMQRDDFLPAHALLAELEIAAGKFAAAEGRIRKLLGRGDTAATGLRLQAELALRQRRYDAAIEAYTAALERERSPEHALGLYRTLQLAGRRDAAVRHMEEWNRAHPGQAAVQRALAEAYLAAGRHREARQAYERIVAQGGADALVLNNLANVLMLLGDPGALAMAERAYRAAPQDANVADTLGLVLLRGGQAERALRYLREARLRAPGNATIRAHLAEALDATGRGGEAQKERQAIEALRRAAQ